MFKDREKRVRERKWGLEDLRYSPGEQELFDASDFDGGLGKIFLRDNKTIVNLSCLMK